MRRWVHELFCVALAAATSAVVLPRVMFPPLASAQRAPVAASPEAPPAAEVTLTAPPAPVEDGPAPVAPADEPPAASRTRAPGRAQGGDARALPRGVTYVDGRWVADLRVLPPVRSALAGSTLVPPGEGSHGEGYLLASTDRMGLLHTAGVRPGDVLVGVNGMPLRNPDDALDAISSLRGASRVTFEFRRGARRYSVPLELRGRSPGNALRL